jgi:hypothetical protein
MSVYNKPASRCLVAQFVYQVWTRPRCRVPGTLLCFGSALESLYLAPIILRASTRV